MVAILQEYGTDRMLVNSAADWGKRPAAHLRDRAGDVPRRVRRGRRRPGAVGQPGRVLRPERPARCSTTPMPTPARVRGQLDPARWHDEVPAPRRRRSSISRTAPTCIRPRTSTVCRAAGRLSREPVRERLGATGAGLGLWLARPVAAELAHDPAAVARLAGTLDRRGLEVVTLNGFPYAGFHDPVVSKKVYLPDWSSPNGWPTRSTWSTCWPQLLPTDASYGSISTLPLGWRSPWSPTATCGPGGLQPLAAELAETRTDRPDDADRRSSRSRAA